MGFLFGGKTVNQSAPVVASLRVQTSAYGGVVPAIFGTTRAPANLVQYEDFTPIPHTSTEGSGGKGGSPSVTSTNYTYTAMVLLRLCHGTIAGVLRVWHEKDLTTLAALGMTLFNGSFTQNAFGPMVSKHPDRALTYRGRAYVAHEALDLGDSGTVGNYNFEVQGLRLFLGPGLQILEARIQQGAAAYNRVASALLQSSPDLATWTTRATLSLTDDGAIHTYSVAASSAKLYWRLLANAAPGGAIAAWDPVVIYPIGSLVTYDGDYWINEFGGTRQGLAPFDEYYVPQDEVMVLVSSGWARLDQRALRWEVCSFEMATVAAGADVADLQGGLSGGDWQTDGTATYEAGKAFDGNAGSSWISAQRAAAVSGAAWIGQGFGLLDANPADVLNDMLSNTDFGAGFPSASIASLTAYSNYCAAAGLLVSPAYTEQQTAAELGASLLKITNSDVVMSEGQLKVVPLGDEAVTANGVTYTPDLTVRFQLGDDDFQPADGEDPVQVERVPNTDAYNQVTVNFYNRDNAYALEPANATDPAHIRANGAKPMDPEEIREVVDAPTAQRVAQVLLQREMNARNKYSFKLDWRYSALEPLDIVGITDAALGCVQYPVRILQIDDSDEILSVIAEDLAIGSATPLTYGAQTGAGTALDFNIAAPAVNAPVIFDMPGALADSGFEIGVALSGSAANWGGAQVWVATDIGGPYTQVGTIYGPARHGELTAAFAAGLDPDTANSCAVDLSVSGGTLAGGTQDDADALNTLAWVEGEFFSFEAATLTGPNAYTLGTYLRRGAFNSADAAHAAGDRFVRVDQAVWRYAYDPALIGSTLYFKCPSFNQYGSGNQALADVVAQAFRVNGPAGRPDDVRGFIAAQTGTRVLMSWDLIDAHNIDGYEIRYAATAAADQSWESAYPLTQVTKGTSVTSERLPPGSFKLMIKARDKSKKYSANEASTSITMSSTFPIGYDNQPAPDWFNRAYALWLPGTTADHADFGTAFQGPITIHGTQQCTQLSSAFWVAAAALPAAGIAYIIDAHSGSSGYYLAAKPNGHLEVFLGDGTLTSTTDVPATLGDGAPHHVALTVDTVADVALVYVDGGLAATIAITGFGVVNPQAGSFRLGLGRDGTQPFKGTIGELMLWRNMVLTPVQVGLVYEGYDDFSVGFSGKNFAIGAFPKSACQVYFDFNNDLSATSTTTTDLVNGTTCTFSGGATRITSSMGSKFVLHPAGVLMPENRYTAAHYADWAEFDAAAIPDPFEICRWILPKITLPLSNGLERVYAGPEMTVAPGEGTGAIAPAVLQLFAPNFGKGGGGYVWNTRDIGVGTGLGGVYATSTYPRLLLDTTRGAVPIIKGFETLIDFPDLAQHAEGQTAGPTGTTVTFPVAYHNTPNVQVTAQGIGLTGVATGITNTGFTVHVSNAGGEVGGTYNYISSGN
jgi:hypothetical protein